MIYVLQSIYGKDVGSPNILGLLLILRFSFSVGSGTDTEFKISKIRMVIVKCNVVKPGMFPDSRCSDKTVTYGTRHV